MKKIIGILCTFILFSGCESVVFKDDPSVGPRENFEHLWTEARDRYSFFEYKEVNWDSVYIKYDTLVTEQTDPVDLFQILFAMLNELDDAHVNLVSTFNVSRFDLSELGPVSIDFEIIKKNYLGLYNYYITGPFNHYFLDSGNIGYINYSSFASDIADSDLDFMLKSYRDTKGLIIDLRQNGGGSISNVFTLISRFVSSSTPMYQSYLKNGPGPLDFEGPQIAYAEPNGNYQYLNKPIVLLTDRGSYSATSFFTLAMRELPNVTIIGDSTGGGLGIPHGGQLPNGWTYRFSISQTLSMDGENYENGIPPDIFVPYSNVAALQGRDNILDRAIQELQ